MKWDGKCYIVFCKQFNIKIADGVQVGPQAGVPQSLDGSLKYVIGAPAMSMKDLAAITLAPKMISKLKAEIKALKASLGDNGKV